MPTITCSKCGSRQESREYFVLEGDTFYTFECGECTNNAPVFSRHSLKWLTLTHLVLFHLSATTTNKDTRFFAWKDGICAFIDAHWDKLLPGRARSLTWQNTLAKELSTHPDIFVAGKLQAGNLKGFWALVDPSVPPSASSDTVKKTQKVKAEKRSSVDSPVDPATSSTQQQQQQQPPQKKQRKKKESTPTVDSVPDTINQPILPPVAPTAPPIVEHTLPVQQSLPPPATLATLSKKEQIHPQHAGKQPRKGPVIHSDLEEYQTRKMMGGSSSNERKESLLRKIEREWQKKIGSIRELRLSKTIFPSLHTFFSQD
ncbi:hypothetical protein BCR33DRAFT_416358 [Rhizoclosmatium globosum]|uniref:Uncharacterized protein n=1 Tax=Rhizoclosmatium globosum TaxID=329046 RepID=A0A1Y2BW98_9FUNG|nr:hypothetical protein BCR33DRAFT_416358 [Rhizoclosmatium globosum]|eukprot:ORY39018.1 hypothetical protein BCR33DRAFT_416358 [Rhizoclosmatium globosum]